MENYPRWFIKAGLIYALLGALLGLGMAVAPASAARIRFVHIHFNLLGFMTMMVAGVAYHVLPRFNARPVPWPKGVKYQFILQNIGLVGMAFTHAAWGGIWSGGWVQGVFIASAATAAVSFFIMFYNLYFVLLPARPASPPERITGDMKVGAVLDRHPKAMAVFLESGFAALANPVAKSTLAKVVTIDQACGKHGIDSAEFLGKLNRALAEGAGEPARPARPAGPPAEAARPVEEPAKPVAEGSIIRSGERCKPDTLVGSLIKVYPQTKAVFEKHYGEGCFSCPGQAFETVRQTAEMHNIDAALILKELNEVIAQAPPAAP